MTAKQSRYEKARMIAEGRWLESLQAAAGEPVYTCPTWGVDIDGRYVTGYRDEIVIRLRKAGYNIESAGLNYYRLVA